MRLPRSLLILSLILVDISGFTFQRSESVGEEVPTRHDTRVNGKIEVRTQRDALQFQKLRGILWGHPPNRESTS